eukprot:TRINITY_DN1443_c1_g1_i5.p1 TRINITY_DN1443_c1_g1~~TRINITY_DN1443_c1_g1_i5.p1  ORF type:complete len:963 (-),score=105.83 TRINITY_DN1443_c1_g1_i5:1795-4683(-)
MTSAFELNHAEPAGFWDLGRDVHALPARSQSQPAERSSSYNIIYNSVVCLLCNPSIDLVQCMYPDGSVFISTLFSHSDSLSRQSKGLPDLVVRAIQSTKNRMVAVCTLTMRVRLLTSEEKLHILAEQQFAIEFRRHGYPRISIEKFVTFPDISKELEMLVDKELKEQAHGSSGIDRRNAMALKTDALVRVLEKSQILRVILSDEHSDGSDDLGDDCAEEIDAGAPQACAPIVWVGMRPPADVVCPVAESFLQEDPKAVALFDKEGEVPLAWLASRPPIQRILGRFMVNEKEEALDVLRAGLDGNDGYRLDYWQQSVQRVETSRAPQKSVASRSPGRVDYTSAISGASRGVQRVRTARCSRKGASSRSPLRADGSNSALEKSWQHSEQRVQTARQPRRGVASRSPPRVDHSRSMVNETRQQSTQQSRTTWIPQTNRALRSPLGVDVIERMLDDSRKGNVQETRAPRSNRRLDHKSYDEAPKERDVREMQSLLSFYFQPFNFQMNRLLMGLVDAQLRQHPRPRSLVLKLSDLAALPRVARLIDRCGNSVESQRELIARALALTSGKQEIPLKMILPVDGSESENDVSLELSPVPSLRYVEGDEYSKAVRALRQPSEAAPCMPKHAITVVSYSVSSDLSHGESPRALVAYKGVVDGVLEPRTVEWEVRQKALLRQLLNHSADILCVQGVQSIGFAERCSETSSAWFNCSDEPSSNHLVHLYEALSMHNYGVVFAPIMKLPGSKALCFGNAVFWKRSRWTLDGYHALNNTAVSVLLISKCQTEQEHRLLVCSAKPSASLALEWGTDVRRSELSLALHGVSQSISKIAAESNASPIWCGDFGTDFSDLNTILRESCTGVQPWKSAFTSMFGREPRWTALSGYVANRAVDGILFNDSLRVEAVLSDVSSRWSLTEFLQLGYPSDHLMHLAHEQSHGGRRSQHRKNPSTSQEPSKPEKACSLFSISGER